MKIYSIDLFCCLAVPRRRSSLRGERSQLRRPDVGDESWDEADGADGVTGAPAPVLPIQ